jgi:hypothetical protein
MLSFFAVLSPVTLTFIIFICLAGVFFHVRYNPRTLALGPTLLTTIGIFATFLGIALGLYHFDTTNVQASIPALLDGLNTAFFASVFGVGFAITLKLRELTFGDGMVRDQDVAPEDITAADLVNHLRDIREALTGAEDGSLISEIKLVRQDTNERLAPLRDIQRALSGSEDGSLLTQIRLLRQDSNDRLDALRTSMAEALKKLAEMGSQTLIEALRDVIKDFNQKITEQFGENFKQLNTAVGNLLVWQEQYKGIIETTVGKLDRVTDIIGTLSENFSLTVERSVKFADVAERLGDLLAELESGERRLKEQSEALATLLLKASGSLPEIEKRIENLSVQMANSVRENQRIVGAAMTDSATALRNAVDAVREDVTKASSDLSSSISENQKVLNTALTDNAAAVRTTVQDAGTAIAAISSEFGRQVTDLVAEARDQMETLAVKFAGMMMQNQEMVGKTLTDNAVTIRNSIEAAHKDMTATNAEFNRQVVDLANKTREQVATLDAALATELQKALESLARQFTAISERFARDYIPLADELRKIVELARVR